MKQNDRSNVSRAAASGRDSNPRYFRNEMNQLHFKFEAFAYSMAVGYFTIAVQFGILCLAFYIVHFVARAARDTTWHRLFS